MSQRYWSSTTHVSGTDGAWRLRFQQGDVDATYNYYSYYVRAVRGGQSDNTQVDNGDGTVTGISTGLMWQQEWGDVNSDGESAWNDEATWQQALQYCENLKLAGHSDWRLPNIRELQSIADHGRWAPAIDPVFSSRGRHWASTSLAFRPDYAWLVDFFHGYAMVEEKVYHNYVRAVRTGL